MVYHFIAIFSKQIIIDINFQREYIKYTKVNLALWLDTR